MSNIRTANKRAKRALAAHITHDRPAPAPAPDASGKQPEQTTA